ncbi:MAG: hypothetical protein KBS75_09155 [Bacteroidales bacterium]|nr:hypothetical protein [Candidatus Equimonas faecalis]
MPEGNITDYLYHDVVEEGEVVGYYYDYVPLPVEEPADEPSQLDRIEAQAMFTALMTDTLLEV